MASENDENEQKFAQRIGELVSNCALSMAISVGWRLGLFDTLGTFEVPATSKEIAAKAGLKERYVREFLNACATGKMLAIDETGSKYFLPRHRLKILSTKKPSGPLAPMLQLMPLVAPVFEDLLECFKPSGPNGISYEKYQNFHTLMDKISSADHSNRLISHTIPSIPENIQAKLESGITCLDVGCSLGTVVMILAKSFPKSTFFGFDLSAEAIAKAQEGAAGAGLKNAKFEVQNCAKLPPEWSEKFDFATAFDAIHDQGRPDLGLKEIFRVLKPGGCFSMFEPNCSSNPKENLGEPFATMMYSISLMHCMPVSLAQEGGIGVGAAWGRETAAEFLRSAGFADVRMIPAAEGSFNMHIFGLK